jgi:peptidyl-tRNA hydrolase, PTH2 family
MNNSKELKMWLVVRGDIEIPKGKLAAQAGHGFCSALMKAINHDRKFIDETYEEPIVEAYFRQNQPKITVIAKNLAALERGYTECVENGLPCAIIEDLGRTIFPEPTTTVFAVGPCFSDELPKFVQRFQLMKE